MLLAYSIKHSLQKLQRHEDHLKNEDYDEGDLRYGKICILADADVDGSHIQVLLITLFLKHFPGLVKNGRLFVAQPPLYRIDIKGKYRKEFGEKVYVRDENELQKRFKKKDEIYAGAIVKARILSKQRGPLETSEILETLYDSNDRPNIYPWLTEWKNSRISLLGRNKKIDIDTDR